MQKPPKGKMVVTPAQPVPPPSTIVDRADLTRMVEGLLDVLGRHEADPTDGVLSLLTALMQAADRVLEFSTPEETEHNRDALVSMLDHARQFVESWPDRTPDHWRVH